jgi:uncharacterized membrane protein YbhN (UPF0104 family)
MTQPDPQIPEVLENPWWRRTGALIGLVLFAGLAAVLASRWQELPSEVLDPNWPQLICAFAILLASLGSTALLWGRILAALDSKLSAVEVVHIHFICQTGKYLPGKVLLVVGKVVLAIRQGCARGAVGASVVYEQALFILSGGLAVLCFAAFASADVVADHRAAVATLCALALVGLHPFVLNRLVGVVEKLTGSELSGLVLAYPKLLGLLIAYAIPWLLAGVGYYLFVDALGPMELALLPDMGAVFALSGLVGVLALFAPAGIGVREAAMSAMLSAYMPVAASIAVALAFRVALVAVDVIALAIALSLQAQCRRRAAEVG